MGVFDVLSNCYFTAFAALNDWLIYAVFVWSRYLVVFDDLRVSWNLLADLYYDISNASTPFNFSFIGSIYISFVFSDFIPVTSVVFSTDFCFDKELLSFERSINYLLIALAPVIIGVLGGDFFLACLFNTGLWDSYFEL